MQSNLKVLSGILVLLAAVAWFVINSNNKTELVKGPVASELRDNINSVDKLTITKNNQSIHLYKVDDLWKLMEADSYPADINKVADLLLGLRQMELKTAKTSNPQKYSKLNLADVGKQAATRVKLYAADTVMADLYVGKQSTKIDGSYIRKADDKQTWLASGRPNLSLDPNFWMVKTILNVTPPQIQSVEYFPLDSESFKIQKTSPDQVDFSLSSKISDTKQTSQQELNGLADGLVQLKISEAMKLKDEHLQAPVNSIIYTLFNNKSYQLSLHNIEDKYWLIVKLGKSQSYSSFEQQLDQWAFYIPEYKFDALNLNLNQVLLSDPKSEADF